MIDIHNHYLPGVDDGADTLEDSLALVRLAVAQGITKVVCTPHYHHGRYDWDGTCSILIKHKAKALIPDADDAMPELCGKVLEVSILK